MDQLRYSDKYILIKTVLRYKIKCQHETKAYDLEKISNENTQCCYGL